MKIENWEKVTSCLLQLDELLSGGKGYAVVVLVATPDGCPGIASVARTVAEAAGVDRNELSAQLLRVASEAIGGVLEEVGLVSFAEGGDDAA